MVNAANRSLTVRPVRFLMALLLALGPLFAFAASPAWAADGDLDASFGAAGVVTTPIGSRDDIINRVAVQNDGKVVAAGQTWNGANWDIALTRYNSNGSLDTSFGGSGKVVTAIGSGDDIAQGLAIQSDGKIVVAGTSHNGSDYDFALVRYNSNGTVDSSFSGGKIVPHISSGTDIAYSAIVQSDGKIVAAGTGWNGQDYDFVILRFSSSGVLDGSFGTNGILFTHLTPSDDIAGDILQQSDGKLVVSGWTQNPSTSYFELARYNLNGSLDNSFGSGGIVATHFPSGFAIASRIVEQSDGKIVVGGQTTVGGKKDSVLLRHNPDGSLDSTFGTGGIVVTVVSPDDDNANGVALQNDGKIVTAGFAVTNGTRDFAVKRHNADGSLDNSFGTGGIVKTSLSAADDQGIALALQSDGKIVAAGFAGNGANKDFATVRYIGGTTYTISGHVQTKQGASLGNVTVTGTSSISDHAIPSALTNASGDFFLTQVPNGTYNLNAVLNGYSFSPAPLNVTVSGGSVAGQDFVAYPWVSLTGLIRDGAGNPVANVRVALSPAPVGVTSPVSTNSTGTYVFRNVRPGNYTITPALDGYSFNPASRSVTVATVNLANLNFTAGPGFSITGRVAMSNGTGIANVRVTRTGSTTAIYTSGAGYFTFAAVPNGTYQITPSLSGYSFSPAYQMVTVNGANLSNVNFTGGYSISGRISDSSGAGLSSVTVMRTGSPYPVQTNGAGYFTFYGVAPGTYTITPSQSGYGFSPETRSVTITNSSVAGQNFIASSGYRISGRIATSSGVGMANVTVRRTGSSIPAVTSSAGYYIFSGVPNGVYTVTPSQSGKTFTPVSRSVTVNGADVAGQNFIGQ